MAMQTSSIQQDYTGALDRWLGRQQLATQQYQGAIDPLRQTAALFQKGGGYGAGQNQLIDDQARQSKAEANLSQVRSGMSSGSLATSTGLRVDKDRTTAKLGVEDTRTQFLAQAMSSLSALKAQQASQTASQHDPYFNTFQSNKTAMHGQSLNYSSQAANRTLQARGMVLAQKEADRQYDFKVQEQKNRMAVEKAKLAADSGKSTSGTYKTLKF